MRLLVTIPEGEVRRTFIGPDEKAAIEALGEIVWNESGRNWSEEELAEQIPGIDVAITGWGSCAYSEKVLARADSLRCIAHTGGSVAGKATEAVYDRGIAVLSGNDLYARSVAESVIAYALYLLRDMGTFSSDLLQKGWSQPGWKNEGLLDQSVGLIGFGAVARHTANLLRAFGCKVKIFADHVTDEEAAGYGAQKATLEEILSSCKIVSLHMAKTPETFHFIGREQLGLLSPGSIFINTARGAIVDEAALADELATGRFRAALDVYEAEPLPMDSPLRKLPNVLLMPHMGGPTMDRRPFVTQAIAKAIPAAVRGEQTNLTITRDMMRRMTVE